MPYRIIERTNTRTKEKDYVVQAKFLWWWEIANIREDTQYYAGAAISPIFDVALGMKQHLEDQENIKYTKKVIDAH